MLGLGDREMVESVMAGTLFPYSSGVLREDFYPGKKGKVDCTFTGSFSHKHSVLSSGREE